MNSKMEGEENKGTMLVSTSEFKKVIKGLGF